MSYDMGARVTYCVTRRQGSGLGISVKEGTIVGRNVGDGLYAIKTKNGRIVHAKEGVIRSIDKPNALTEVLKGRPSEATNGR